MKKTSQIIKTLMALLCLNHSASADLLTWWSFNEEANSEVAIDHSGNGNDGQLINFDLTADSNLEPGAGKFGGAVHFDGVDDYVTNTTGFQPAGTAFTYAFFFKPDAENYGVGHERDDLIYSNPRPHFSFGRDGGGDGQIGMYFTMDGDTELKSTTNEWPNDTWHHVAWTYDGLTIRMYVNGIEESSLERSGNHMPLGDGRFHLGSNAGGSGYDGYVDDLTVWDEALSEADLTAIAANGMEAFLEQREIDSDGDGLPDFWEQLIIDASDADAISELADVLPEDDFDNDGLSNLGEFEAGTNPIIADTDGDGLADGVENNTQTWTSAMMTGTDPRNPDSDGDGLLDGVENPDLPNDPANPADQPGTDPNLSDTDGDSWSDSDEIAAGTDPTDNNSAPSANQRVLFLGANPDPSHSGDPAVMTFLQERYGDLNVEYRQASAAQTGDELNFGALILSSSPASGDIRGKFQDSPVPILNWEEAVAKDAAGEFAITAGRLKDVSTHAVVIKEAHPITAGFEVGSTIALTTGETELWWSTDAQAPGSLSVAFDDDNEANLFFTLIDEGDELLNGSLAPGRRVMLGLSDSSFNVLTDDGRTLIGQAIDWLLGLTGPSRPTPIVAAIEMDENVRIDFTTPDPDSPHVIEESDNLLGNTWQPIADATLETVGEFFRFTVPRPEVGEHYYRIGMLPPPPLFFEDFESGAEGWTATTASGDTNWELGLPSATNLTTAHSGENVYGTDLDAPYVNSAMASLRSPIIDLTDAGLPRLSFWYYVDATAEAEGVQLRILNEAGDESALYTHGQIFWGASEDWTEFQLVIPAAARGQRVILEWLLLTDSVEPNGDGFFLDDVTVD